MKRAYWRCNSGHYFATAHCPFDGWSSEQLLQLSDAAERLRASGKATSIDGLRAEGAEDSALRKTIVVEFGGEEAVFDAISPDYYVIDSKSVRLQQAGIDFH